MFRDLDPFTEVFMIAHTGGRPTKGTTCAAPHALNDGNYSRNL